jgi:hypothetical protein
MTTSILFVSSLRHMGADANAVGGSSGCALKAAARLAESSDKNFGNAEEIICILLEHGAHEEDVDVTTHQEDMTVHEDMDLHEDGLYTDEDADKEDADALEGDMDVHRYSTHFRMTAHPVNLTTGYTQRAGKAR